MADTPNSRRDLWRAVIRQALSDATSKAKETRHVVERARARTWFEVAGADFQEVCGLADYEPCQVRKEALAYIAEVDARIAANLPAKPPKPKPAPRKVNRYTYQGEAMTIAEWSVRTGINASTLSNRLGNGWTVERALTTPVVMGAYGNPETKRDAKRLTHEGVTLSVDEWATRISIPVSTLHIRLESRWSVARTLTTPDRPQPVEISQH